MMGIVATSVDEVKALFDFDKFRSKGSDSEKKSEQIIEEKFEKPIEEKKEEPVEEKAETAEEVTENLKKGFENLNPAMVIGIFDIAISRGFSMLTNMFGYASNYKDYSLDEKEKKFLIPFVESVVMDWLKTLKPRDVLIVALILMYSGKTFDVTQKYERNKGKKRTTQRERVERPEEERTVNTRYNKDGSVAAKRGPKGPRS